MIGSAETVLGNVKRTRHADSSKRSERNAKKFYSRLVSVSSRERWRKKRRVPRGLEMMIETKRMRGLNWTSLHYLSNRVTYTTRATKMITW